MTDPARPFVMELDSPAPDPGAAAPVPETGADGLPVLAQTGAMTRAMASRKGRAGAVLAWALGSFVSLALGIATQNFIAGLLETSLLLGGLAMALAGVAVTALVWIAAREWAAWLRLGRVDGIRARAVGVSDPASAHKVLAELDRLYARRDDMARARARVAELSGNVMDADALIQLAERELLAGADIAARREIETAARRVAVATAFVPLALVDVAVALAANLAMIRRVAEIYGGRAGSLGSWRLLRRVFAHLVATGAVAVGDDLVSSVAGGGVMSKLSRRFGEGVVNAALTARVGVAAMEICRPLPFSALDRPGVTRLVARALAGVFGRDTGTSG